MQHWKRPLILVQTTQRHKSPYIYGYLLNGQLSDVPVAALWFFGFFF